LNTDRFRPYTVCFTGHRQIPEQEKPTLRRHLRETVRQLIDDGCRYFAAGGALGFDTMAAQTVLELREIFPDIRLILVLPCPDQTARWRPEDVRIYEEILAASDKHVYVSEHYTPGCMMARNRRMVDGSRVCVCYLTKSAGGTAATVDYAARCGLEILRLG